MQSNLWVKGENVYTYFDLIDEIVESVLIFNSWAEDGLINVNYIERSEWAKYKIIIFDGSDLIYDYQTEKYDSGSGKMILKNKLYRPLPGYTLKIFDGTRRDYYSVNSMAIASPDADASEFLRFMEWLRADIENYKLFRFGIDGEDYGLTEGGETEMLISDYSVWFYNFNPYFRRDDWDFSLQKHYMSGIDGYPQKIIDARRPYGISLDEGARGDIRSIGRELYSETRYNYKLWGSSTMENQISGGILHASETGTFAGADDFYKSFIEGIDKYFYENSDTIIKCAELVKGLIEIPATGGKHLMFN